MVVSCSCFAPTPSMAAMLVNHFKLRRDVLTYNLSGMGCSSSLICIDMVKHLLKVRAPPPTPAAQRCGLLQFLPHLSHAQPVMYKAHAAGEHLSREPSSACARLVPALVLV